VPRPGLAVERQYYGEKVLVGEGFRSLVVVPLVVRGKSIGTLNLGSLKPMQYGSAEAELLREVANQLALAIENMREYAPHAVRGSPSSPGTQLVIIRTARSNSICLSVLFHWKRRRADTIRRSLPSRR